MRSAGEQPCGIGRMCSISANVERGCICMSVMIRKYRKGRRCIGSGPDVDLRPDKDDLEHVDLVGDHEDGESVLGDEECEESKIEFTNCFSTERQDSK